MDDARITIGRIVKPHGIRGEVVVVTMSDRPGRFDAGVEVTGGGRTFTIVSSRPHQGRLLLRLDGISDRTAAESLRGTELEADPLPGDGGETYLAADLIGMRVVGEDGQDLGAVSSLIELPAAAGYDLLEVTRSDGATWLLPAAPDLVEVEVTDADDAGRVVVIDPPLGLVTGDAAVVPPGEG